MKHEKYNLEEMNRRNREQIQMENIGMSDNEPEFLKMLILDVITNYLAEGLRDKYKTFDIEKYLKNMDKLRQRRTIIIILT